MAVEVSVSAVDGHWRVGARARGEFNASAQEALPVGQNARN
jgi:hypothetical protein